MRLNIEIDFTGLEDIEDDYYESIEYDFSEIQDEIERMWVDKVSEVLTDTRQQYLDGLKFEKSQDSMTVTVEGFVPASMELGIKSYDLKPGFLKGRQSRVIPLWAPGTKFPVEFRTVTANSHGWIHRGEPPKRLPGPNKFDKGGLILDYIEEEFGHIIDRIMKIAK